MQNYVKALDRNSFTEDIDIYDDIS